MGIAEKQPKCYGYNEISPPHPSYSAHGSSVGQQTRTGLTRHLVRVRISYGGSGGPGGAHEYKQGLEQ